MASRSTTSGCVLLIVLGFAFGIFLTIVAFISVIAAKIGVEPTSLALGLAIVALLASVSVKICTSGMRKRNEKKRIARLRKQRQEMRGLGETAFDELLKQVRQLVYQHRDALQTQFRCNVYKDHYGQIIFDRWTQELVYFTEKIVFPVVQPWIHAFEAGRNAYSILVNQIGAGSEETYPFPADIRRAIFDFISAEFGRMMSEGPPVLMLETDVHSGEGYGRFCAAKLRSVGWSVIERGGCGDQGVDLLAEKNSVKIAFQCKSWETPVGNDAVQQAHTGSAIIGADYAAVVSRSGYTKAARIAAHATGVHLLATEDLVRIQLDQTQV